MVDIIKFNTPPKYLDESFLKREYVEKGLSLRKIAQKMKCSRGVIKSRLVKVGVNNFCYKTEKIKVETYLVKKINSMRRKGVSYKQIAVNLNKENITTRTTSGIWHKKTVREVCLT